MAAGDTSDSAPGGDPTETALDLIGYPEQLRGQTVHAGIRTGVFELLLDGERTGKEIADDLDLDTDYAHRLLRALAAYGLLAGDAAGRVSLTPAGERFLADHPESVRDVALFFYHPARYAAIRHLPEIVAEGGSTGYEVEFGYDIFEYCDRHPAFGRYFNGFQDQMNTFGRTERILETMEPIDFSAVSTICDVGGGYGVVLCHLLAAHPHLEGTVLELPSVLEDEDRRWAPRLGVDDRCTYVAGDMFEAVPPTDAYLLKDILHDWTDEDCIRILANVHAAANEAGHLYVIERPISEADPAPAIIDMDMLMMLETGGRERTKAEYQSLFADAGWTIDEVLRATDELAVMDCVKT